MDSCMEWVIKFLQVNGIKTLASCCGHGKYPMSIIAKDKLTGWTIEIFSATILKNKRRWYKQDKQGYYYIPEVTNEQRRI